MSAGTYCSAATKKELLNFLDRNCMAIVYDLETTGFSPEKNHIIQISARKCFISDDGLEEVESGMWYINPGYSIPEKIVELTGITDAFVADKPTEAEVIEEVSEFFDTCPVIGYNIRKFDNRFMDAMFQRYGAQFRPEDAFDIYKAAREMIEPGETINYKLPTITKHMGFEDQIAQFHNAEGDTMASLLCFNRFVQIAREQLSGQVSDLIRCNVRSVKHWMNPRKSRMEFLYVDTDRASFRYDQYNRRWAIRDMNDRIERYDMEDVIQQVIDLTGAADEDALSKFRGCVYSRPRTA